MAYRNVHEKFWTDPKVKTLNPDQKLFFLYLITNPHTHVAGIYNLPLSYAERETGLSHKTILTAIVALEKAEIIMYDPFVEIVWIKKMYSYQGFGPKIHQSVGKQLESLHHSKLIPLFCKAYSYPMPYPIDRVSDTLPVSVPVSDELKEEGSGEKPKEFSRIRVRAFNRQIQPDEYCVNYGNEHGLNGKTLILWGRMIDWHLKNAKGTDDLHASWRGWVDRAPEYNKDLFVGSKPGLNAHLPSIAEIKAKKGEHL